MMKVLILLFCISLAVECKLKFLTTLHRHGARTPNKFYKPGYWPEGKAQLTEYGKKQLFELGKEYRARYITNDSEEVRDFFPKEWSEDHIHDILVLSSPKERAFESFTYFYQGLFDNSSVEVQRVNITSDEEIFGNQSETGKKVVNVYVPPVDSDFYLHAFDSDVCTKAGVVQSAIKASEAYQEKLNHYRETLFPTLAQETNEKWGTKLVPENMTFAEMSSVLDLVYSANTHNITRDIPVFSDEIMELLNEAKRYYVFEGKFGDPFLSQVTVTKVFGLLKRFLEERFKGDGKALKWFEISAHDTDIAGFLKALLTEEELYALPKTSLNIPYASHFELEFHDNEDLTVRLTYDEVEVTMGKCGTPCTLDSFISLITDLSLQEDLVSTCSGTPATASSFIDIDPSSNIEPFKRSFVAPKLMSKKLMQAAETPDGIDMAKDSISSFTSNWTNSLEELKNSNNTEIQQILLRKGFSFFAQSAQVQKVIGIREDYFGKFKQKLLVRLEVPSDKVSLFEEFLDDFLSKNERTWTAFQMIYSRADGMECKFVSILARHSAISQRIDFLISDVKAQFDLARDILVISESVSIDGGKFTESDIKLKEIPKAVSEEDLKSVMDFFKIVSFKNFADMLGIQADLPSFSSQEARE